MQVVGSVGKKRSLIPMFSSRAANESEVQYLSQEVRESQRCCRLPLSFGLRPGVCRSNDRDWPMLVVFPTPCFVSLLCGRSVSVCFVSLVLFKSTATPEDFCEIDDLPLVLCALFVILSSQPKIVITPLFHPG